MRLFQKALMLFGLLFLLLTGCDTSTEISSTKENSSEKPKMSQPIEKATVSPAVEGAQPAVADREKDMVLVARETQQNETEQEAIRKDMEQGMKQAESERAAPQQLPE